MRAAKRARRTQPAAMAIAVAAAKSTTIMLRQGNWTFCSRGIHCQIGVDNGVISSHAPATMTTVIRSVCSSGPTFEFLANHQAARQEKVVTERIVSSTVETF